MPYLDLLSEEAADAIVLLPYDCGSRSVMFYVDLDDELTFCGTLRCGCERWQTYGDGYLTPYETVPCGVWADLRGIDLQGQYDSVEIEDADDFFCALQAALQNHIKQNY